MPFEISHVQVAPPRDPLLALFHRQCRHETQARFLVGEDPHHTGATLYLLVETLQTVCGADAPAAALGESKAAEALLEECSSMCSATFSLLFLRHFSATEEAIVRACFLLGAAAIARRSEASSLRLA